MNQLTPYQQAENVVIEKAKRQFQRDLGDTGQPYGAEPLNYGSLVTAIYSKPNNHYLSFTRTVDGTPIHISLQPIIRAYIVLSQGKPHAKRSRLTPIKTLAIQLTQYCESNNLDIAWSYLTEPLLEQTEQYYQAHKAQATTYHAAGVLSQFAKFLSINNLCRRLDYYPATPCPQTANLTTLAGQKRGQEKLPSQRALRGLAKLYNNTATTEDDQFILSALAILFCTGLRIGELLTLPLDCESEEGGYYFIRYYNQKADNDHEQVTLGLGESEGDRAQIVQEAIAKIKALTAAPRERARTLEANPGHCPIPNYGPEDLIRTDDLRKLLGGIDPETLQVLRKQGKLIPQKIGNYNYYTAALVESFLQTRLPAQLWTKQLKDNTYQRLSQSLFVIFQNFLHANSATNPLICCALTSGQLYHYISPQETGKGTLFERHNIREDNGEFCRIHPHQFRHYIDTCLRKGGMSPELITIYRNRSSVMHTRQYDHWDEDDSSRLGNKLSDGIREGIIVGTATRTYNILPVSRRDHYLEGVVGNIHVNIFGYCVHDFKATPCPHSGRCLKGCTDFLIEAGDPKQYQAALTLRTSTQHAIDSMERQFQRRRQPAPEDWLAGYNDIITGCNSIIAAHESAIASREQKAEQTIRLISPDEITVTSKKES